jgi:exosortase B
MTTATDSTLGRKAGPAPVRAGPPVGMDPWAWGAVACGLAALFVPTYWDLAHGRYAGYSQGYEFLALVVSGWLMFRRRADITALPTVGSRGAAMAFGVALLVYALARSQQLLRIELVALVFSFASLIVCVKGWPGLRRLWFPVFFLLFTVPLPYALVLQLTGPMKSAVSVIATWLLHGVGYPVGRSGVVITAGQYQLLVAEACAGLQTMFTLEAMGLLYANLMGYGAWLRNVLLSVAVVPVAFFANVVRVLLIVLITYHFGDEAGQGFIHGFAGMALFAVALAAIIGVDKLLGRVLPERSAS